MIYYRLKYGLSGMSKIITKQQYDDLCFGDKSHYEVAVPIICGSATHKSSEEIMQEEEDAYLESKFSVQFWD